MLYKNRLSADLNLAVIPKYFLFDFINTEGYFVRHRLVLVKVQNCESLIVGQGRFGLGKYIIDGSNSSFHSR